MESLQFVGCSWFIGLIGLGFRFTRNKSTETELYVHLCPSPVSSSTHLDVPGVHSLACVYYCRTYDKAVYGGGRGTVKDMCYEVRRAEACVD